MRIGIDIRLIGKKRTGDEAVFFNLVKNLALLDSENEYLLFTDIINTTIIPNIVKRLGIENNKNFKIIPLVAVRPLQNKFGWNFWTLPNYLRKNPMDIYLTQYITPFFVSKKIKIITIIHDISFKIYPQYIKFSDLFFLKILIPLSFRRADKIIGVSQFTRDEILKYYKIDPDKIEWIHNAAGDNFAKEISQEEMSAVKKKYGLPEKFILYIGTLQPRKNLSALIEAYAKLPENIKSEIKLVLAGGKGHNYDFNIDKTIKKLKLSVAVSPLQKSDGLTNASADIILPGFINEEDKPALLKLSSIFCNPSFYEGFGITILEAMTLGIPVLASKIPPHREVAEESILYFNPASPEELSEKLKLLRANSDLREELKQKELIRAKNFSWLNTAQKILNMLKSMG